MRLVVDGFDQAHYLSIVSSLIERKQEHDSRKWLFRLQLALWPIIDAHLLLVVVIVIADIAIITNRLLLSNMRRL